MKPKPRFKITLEDTLTGKAHKLSLIPQPWRGRYWLRYNDGKAANPETTITKVTTRLREIMVEAEKDN